MNPSFAFYYYIFDFQITRFRTTLQNRVSLHLSNVHNTFCFAEMYSLFLKGKAVGAYSYTCVPLWAFTVCFKNKLTFILSFNRDMPRYINFPILKGPYLVLGINSLTFAKLWLIIQITTLCGYN